MFKRVGLIVLPTLAMGMLVFQLFYQGTRFITTMRFMAAHLAIAMVLVGLTDAFSSKKLFPRIFWTVAATWSAACLTYIYLNVDALEMRGGYPTGLDVTFAIPLIILVLIYTWKHWGAVFPIFSVLCLIYAFTGENSFWGPIRHTGGEWGMFIYKTALIDGGIFGSMLMLGAATIWIYIVFGNMLEVSRATAFFLEVGKVIGRMVKGGAALIAVVASSLVGTCTGASVANVTITGTFTIPLMKKTGVKPPIAGAVECVASNGGQFVPPVLGAAAFLMVGLAGYSYKEIVTASLGVAFLYYAFTTLAIILTAGRDKWPRLPIAIDKKAVLYGGIPFILPIGLLTVLLYQGYSPALCGYYAFAALVLISVISPYSRPKPRILIQGFTKAITGAARLSLVTACLGIPVVILEATGLVLKIGFIVEAVAGGQLIIALIAVHLVLMILGCGLPTVAAYAVSAIVCAPTLIRMGLDPLIAHYFCFYNAVFASITPPVALTAVPAAILAETKFWLVTKEAMILSGPLYFLPYMFVYFPFILASPILIGEPLPTSNYILGTVSIIALVGLTAGGVGFFATRHNWFERLLFLAGSALSFTMTIAGNMSLSFIGMGILGAGIVFNILRWRQAVSAEKRAPASA